MQSKTRTPDKTARKDNQTYKNSLFAHRAAEARKAGSKPTAEREAHAEQKKEPQGRTRSARKTQRRKAQQAATPRARPAPKDY